VKNFPLEWDRFPVLGSNRQSSSPSKEIGVTLKRVDLARADHHGSNWPTDLVASADSVNMWSTLRCIAIPDVIH
jgi:hypothetical protein